MGTLSYAEAVRAFGGGPRNVLAPRPLGSPLRRGMGRFGYRGGLGADASTVPPVPVLPASWAAAAGPFGPQHSNQPGTYFSPDVVDKKGVVQGQVDRLSAKVASLRTNFTALHNAAVTLTPPVAGQLFDPVSQKLAPIDSQIRDLETWAAAASSFVSGVIPPGTSAQIATDEWTSLDALGKTADSLGSTLIPNIDQQISSMQMSLEQQRQATVATQSAADTAAATAAANLAAQQQAQAAQLTAQQQQAQLQYQYQTAQLQAQQQAATDQANRDAAAAQAQRDAQAAQQSLILQLAQTQQQTAAQKESDLMALEQARLQSQDTRDAAAQAAAATQQQSQMQMALMMAMINKGYPPTMLPGFPGMQSGGVDQYGMPAPPPGYMYQDDGTGNVSAVPGVGTDVYAGAPAAAPSAGPMGPYIFTAPAAPSGGGSGLDMSPFNPGNEMFGMYGMGALGPVGASQGLPAGAQIDPQYVITGIDSGGYTIVTPEGVAFKMSLAQAQSPAQVADPQGRVFYQGPGSAAPTTTLAQDVQAWGQTLLPIASGALALARGQGAPTPVKPVAPSSGPSAGTLLLGAAAIGTVIFIATQAKKKKAAAAPVTASKNPARRGYWS